MKDSKHQKIILTAYKIIHTFPKAKNDQPFLTLQNGRKLFFNRFIKKYGLDGSITVYNEKDISRRIRLVEFFDYFANAHPVTRTINVKQQRRHIIESHFHRMVIIEKRVGIANKLELLSFYPL